MKKIRVDGYSHLYRDVETGREYLDETMPKKSSSSDF